MEHGAFHIMQQCIIVVQAVLKFTNNLDRETFEIYFIQYNTLIKFYEAECIAIYGNLSVT